MNARPILTLLSLSLCLSLGLLSAACEQDPPPPKVDAAADTRPVDAANPDTPPPLAMTPDAAPAPDAGAGADSASADSNAGTDLAADSAPPADSAPDTGATQSADAGPSCAMGVSREMLCATYCQGIGQFCTGNNAQFPNDDVCRAACNAPIWACGNPGDFTGNSLLCRISHLAFAGLGQATMECPNAGANSPACR
jgi:hypothetical protein